MDSTNYQELYEKLKNNSIGEEKISNSKRTRKQVLLRVSLTTLASVILMTSLVGCGYQKNNNYNQTNTTTESEYIFDDRGYTTGEITGFRKGRVYELMKDNGYQDYEVNNGMQRDYGLSVDQIKELSGLDESYMYGFYCVTTPNMAEKVAIALGYKNIDDYVIIHGYIDENGNPDYREWMHHDKENMVNLLFELEQELKK